MNVYLLLSLLWLVILAYMGYELDLLSQPIIQAGGVTQTSAFTYVHMYICIYGWLSKLWSLVRSLI